MNEITRVGVDLAKRVIQVHAVNATGRVVAAKALPANKFPAWCAQLPPGCLVAMEACGGAHHWARKLRGYGLDARLIAGHFVTPYRMSGKGGKNDANDAAAICEAAGRPHMRFVPVKTPAQQALLAIHRLREGYKEDRTACINRIRGLLTEFGIVFAQSPESLRLGLADVLEDASNELPGIARLALQEETAADPGREVGGDDGPQTQRQDLAVAGAVAGPRGLAEGRGGAGQQERAHRLGAVGQGPRVRSELRVGQAW